MPGMTTKLLSRGEAAQTAGVSLRTIDRWRAEGKLTTYRRRRSIKVNASELEDLCSYEPTGTEVTR